MTSQQAGKKPPRVGPTETLLCYSIGSPVNSDEIIQMHAEAGMTAGQAVRPDDRHGPAWGLDGSGGFKA
jgi:hypothetical protein